MLDVIVGNIGTVYSGSNRAIAILLFIDYVAASKGGVGRAGDEDVTLMEDGEVLQEYHAKERKMKIRGFRITGPPLSLRRWGTD
jgi:hypothetical protein